MITYYRKKCLKPIEAAYGRAAFFDSGAFTLAGERVEQTRSPAIFFASHDPPRQRFKNSNRNPVKLPSP